MRVSTAGGKLAYRGATDASGHFTTSQLASGNYVVEFNTNDRAVRGAEFAILVSAGKRKITADSVSGDKFIAGGVAMKVALASKTAITGYVINTVLPATAQGKVRIIHGRRYFWISETGSIASGRWAEEGSAQAASTYHVEVSDSRYLQNLQDRGGQGAMSGR